MSLREAHVLQYSSFDGKNATPKHWGLMMRVDVQHTSRIYQTSQVHRNLLTQQPAWALSAGRQLVKSGTKATS